MKKLYNIIFPIWLILIVPPIVLLVIPSNFIIDSLVLIIGLKLLKESNWFEKYKKSILKVWIVGFIIDIVGSLLLLVTQFMGNDGFLYENLIYPVVWNPFKSIVAFLYVLVVVLICGMLIYIVNYKYSLKKTGLNKESKKIISILLALITAPYLFFLPTSYLYESKTNSLNDYQDTYIGDNSAVGGIISNIYSGEYLDSFSLDTKELPYGITINYKEKEYGDIYSYLEKDSLILFKLINNVDYVEFNVGDNTYKFDKRYVKNIFEDINDITIEEINSRYNNKYFEEFTYLGHISEYDIFDTSTTCRMDKNLLYENTSFKYYIKCSDIDYLYLVNGDKKKKLKTALEENIIKIDELFQTNLKIIEEDINETNSK